MRLMGRSKLAKLARVDGVSGAVAALCAEIEDASWSSPTEVRGMYPNASVDGKLIRIPIGGTHCVNLVASYTEAVVLVTFADLTSNAPRAHGPKGRKAA